MGCHRTLWAVVGMEAAPRFELGNNGFADRRLSHLAMPPSDDTASASPKGAKRSTSATPVMHRLQPLVGARRGRVPCWPRQGKHQERRPRRVPVGAIAGGVGGGLG